MSILRRLEVLSGRDAPLYHWMDRDKARKVFTSDRLRALFIRPGLDRGISLTRNKNYNQDWAEGDHSVRLTLDQRALAQKQKIIPLDAEIWREKHFNKNIDLNAPEYRDIGDRHSNKSPLQFAEEFLVGDIEPLHRYLLRIYYRHLRHDDERLLKAMAKFIKKYQIPFDLNLDKYSENWKQYAAMFPTAHEVNFKHHRRYRYL